MRLRYVTCDDLISDMIRQHEGVMIDMIGFTPSHVEIAVEGGYLGAHIDGGVQIRPTDYEKVSHELFVDVSLTHEDEAQAWARAHIGQPYDWLAIIGQLTSKAFHAPRHMICSAFVTLALRRGGFAVFAAVPAYAISPRDSLLMLSCMPTWGSVNGVWHV